MSSEWQQFFQEEFGNANGSSPQTGVQLSTSYVKALCDIRIDRKFRKWESRHPESQDYDDEESIVWRKVSYCIH